MEFKGTKGKWRLEQSLFYKTDKVILSEYRAICRIAIEDEEVKANALLISKAPEMLEMLKILRNDYSNYTQNILQDSHRLNRIKEIEQLIKQATEL